jgi:hypothetical protein
MMVNNSTNINHLSSQLTEHMKKITAYDVRNPSPGLAQTQKSGGVKLVNGIRQ